MTICRQLEHDDGDDQRAGKKLLDHDEVKHLVHSCGISGMLGKTIPVINTVGYNGLYYSCISVYRTEASFCAFKLCIFLHFNFPYPKIYETIKLPRRS